jgi:hypothetical protein
MAETELTISVPEAGRRYFDMSRGRPTRLPTGAISPQLGLAGFCGCQCAPWRECWTSLEGGRRPMCDRSHLTKRTSDHLGESDPQVIIMRIINGHPNASTEELANMFQ